MRFPVLIDNVQDAFRTTQMEVDLQDSVTGEISHLVAVGESFDVSYDSERMLTDQGWVRMMALIGVDYVEDRVG